MSNKVMQFSGNNIFSPWLAQPAIWIVIACSLLTLFSAQLPDTHFFDDPVAYLPLHVALEFFSIAVAFLIFAIVWHTRNEHLNGRSLFLASLFVGVGMVDFVHTLTFSGMPALVTPSYPGKAIPFWLAGRLLAVIGLLGAIFWTWDKLKKLHWQLVLLGSVVLLAGSIIWALLYIPGIFPAVFVPGKGLTPFKVGMEYFISALFLLTAGLMFYKSDRASKAYWVYLGSAACIMMLSEFYFTLYAKVTDIYNLIGHLYKIVAYGLVYQAVFVVAVREPYRQVQQLQQEQEKLTGQLQEAQNIAHLGQWEMEHPANTLTWSQSTFDLFEIDSTKFGAKYEDFLALCHPDDRHLVHEHYSASVKNRAPYEFVHRLLMKDGRVKWVRESGLTTYDADGQPVLSRGVTIEITSIMKMEATLRESEGFHRAITESLAVPLAINDQLGNITYLSPYFIQTFGYTLEDIPHVEQWWPRAYPDPVYREEIRLRWWERMEQMRLGNQFQPIEVKVTCKNGMVRTVLSSSVSINESESLIYLYDISALKNAETETHVLREQLAQAGKMEAIGHLTAGIAHDFNNILGAIMGYTELTQHMLAAGTPESVARYQDEVIKAGNRAKELIAQMLAFSRLSPEGNGHNEPPILLSPVVKEVVTLLRSSIPSRININYQIEDDNLTACIMPVHLHQILLNLGINARDVIAGQGRIDVTVFRRHEDGMVCASCKNTFAGDFIEISVKDSGSGIPQQILERIFDPFFTTKSVGKGTGMGLSVVHGLVHALGGHIRVQSAEGKGTEIGILLPLVAATPAFQEEDGSVQSCNIKGVRIMVVDDEHAMASMLQEFLTVYGAQVVSFTDPLLALDEFSRRFDSIDLVITDETMPGMSGMALARFMMKHKPVLPVILCTGHSEEATPESAAEAGMAGFFYKPLKMNELLQKIYLLKG